MSLITNVMDHSLDDGYAEAAARKRAAGEGGMPRTVRARLGLAAGLVLAASGLGFNAEPVLTLVMALVAVLTLLSVGLYLAEWVRHMNSVAAGP